MVWLGQTVRRDDITGKYRAEEKTDDDHDDLAEIGIFVGTDINADA